jgi:hypothetical protein
VKLHLGITDMSAPYVFGNPLLVFEGGRCATAKVDKRGRWQPVETLLLAASGDRAMTTRGELGALFGRRMMTTAAETAAAFDRYGDDPAWLAGLAGR